MNEHDIQRFGRQILLREVGGRGQTKLLTRAVEVTGHSSALAIAAEYLSAAGSPLRLTQPSADLGGGFLRPHERAGSMPDEPTALLLSTGARCAPGLASVSLSSRAVAFVSATGCQACFAHAAASARLSAGADDDPVTLGSLAALIAQRLLLDLSGEQLGLITLSAQGLPGSGTFERCAAHQ